MGRCPTIGKLDDDGDATIFITHEIDLHPTSPLLRLSAPLQGLMQLQIMAL